MSKPPTSKVAMTLRTRTSVQVSARRLFVAIAWAVLAASGGTAAASPLSSRTDCPSADAQPVQFQSTDGKSLKGEVLGAGTVGVVFAHDADSTFCTWQPALTFLSSHGFRVLLFDYSIDPFLSGYGKYPRGTFRFDHDIAGGVAFLRANGVKTIVLAGDGIGGLCALVTAHELGRGVAAVFTLTAGGIRGGTDTLGDPTLTDDLDAVPAVRHLHAPLLLLSDRSDTNAPTLFSAAASASKRWYKLPRVNDFGEDAWTANALWARQARNTVIAFVDAHTPHH